MKNLYVYIIILCSLASTLNAGNTFIDVLDYEILSYPTVKSNFFLFDENYIPTNAIRAEELLIKDSGIEIPLTNLIINKQNPLDTISLVISFDLAIKTSGVKISNFQLARNTALSVINKLSFRNFECAFTSFDKHSYLNQEFTDDSASLADVVNRLIPSKLSDYTAGIISYPIGSIAVSEKAKHEKSILIITDRRNIKNEDLIISFARNNNVKIYCMTMGYETSEKMKKICDSTGGHYFDMIGETIDIEIAASSFLAYAYNYKPLEVYWEPDENCEDIHNIEISIVEDTISDAIEFIFPEIYKPYLEFAPKFLAFSAVFPGETKDMDVVLTARNNEIIIHDITLENELFEIVSGGLTNDIPILRIPKDSSRKITIRFSPIDSSLTFDSLVVSSNTCQNNKTVITGGYPNTPPTERNLTLTSPKCTETLVIGDTVAVEWSGVLPNDVIQLEYSLNNGGNWEILANNINGLEYRWPVPDTITDDCLIRAVQLWPNNVGQTMNFRHEDIVRTANFNELGDMVVTGSKDSTIMVWNSNNGKILHILNGHTGEISWANFSPDGKFIVSASEDSTVKIWDISNPEVKYSKPIKTLLGHKDIVKSANYSPDGKYIITASRDKTIKLWDANSGEFIKNVLEENNFMWFAVFNPDGTKILATGDGGTVKVLDMKKNELINSFNSMIGVVPQASFSPDSKRIIASSWMGRAVVWDINTADTVFTLTHTENDTSGIIALYSANYDFSGKFILTSSSDKTSRMWNAETGELLKVLKEHTGTIYYSIFNFDGSRILTASADSTAKIWNLEKRDLQTDSTDCTIAIANASLSSFDISLGDVLVGESKFALIDTFIVNNNRFPYKIKNVTISGENASSFKIVGYDEPFLFDSLMSRGIEIIFTPSKVGLLKAVIEVTFPGGNAISNISGNGFEQELMAIDEYIDFGKIEIGDFKDSTFALIVRNISKKNVLVTSIELLGPDDEHFLIIDGQEPMKLAPGEGHELILRFIPEELTRSNGKLVFTYEGIGAESIISLFGEGIKPRIDTATVYIETVTALQSDIIEIPIKIKNVSSLGIRESITGFTVDLRFNATMLEPISENYTSRIDNADKILSLNLPAVYDENNILKMLRFRVALGNDTTTHLELSNLTPIGKGKIVLSSESGLFNLDGVCEKGGVRLFEPDGTIALFQNRPNPFDNNTTIEFEVLESGFTKLFVIDMLGKNVKTITEGYFGMGKYSYMISTLELPSGSYYYILQTPTYKISRRMEIRR